MTFRTKKDKSKRSFLILLQVLAKVYSMQCQNHRMSLGKQGVRKGWVLWYFFYWISIFSWLQIYIQLVWHSFFNLVSSHKLCIQILVYNINKFLNKITPNFYTLFGMNNDSKQHWGDIECAIVKWNIGWTSAHILLL